MTEGSGGGGKDQAAQNCAMFAASIGLGAWRSVSSEIKLHWLTAYLAEVTGVRPNVEWTADFLQAWFHPLRPFLEAFW